MSLHSTPPGHLRDQSVCASASEWAGCGRRLRRAKGVTVVAVEAAATAAAASLAEELGSKRSKWRSLELLRLHLEGPVALQQHLDWWGRNSTARDRKRKESREVKEHVSCCLPWNFSKKSTHWPHVRIPPLACGHTKATGGSPHLPAVFLSCQAFQVCFHS